MIMLPHVCFSLLSDESTTDDSELDTSLGPHARQRRWKDVTKKEMQTYIALALLMGVVRKPCIEDYWSTDPTISTPFFASVMSRNRFQAISSNLHICDNRKMPKKRSRQYDALYKIRPFIDMACNNFKKVYKLGRDISIDEGGVPFKGRISFKVYNPKKPNKFSMKFYEVCESKTGYVYHFEVYTGKADSMKKANASTGLTTKLVMRLLREADLLGKGHHVYFDNYYTSPDLFRQLLRETTYACGTVRQNRKGLPEALKEAKIKSGQSVWRRSDDALLALKWKDKKDVFMLSSIHKANQKQTRFNFQNEAVVKPVVVADYTENMAGVDLNDQFLSYYASNRKTVKWWQKMFFHVLNMIVTNAWILQRTHDKERNKKCTEHVTFVKDLVKHLAGVREVETQSQAQPQKKTSNSHSLSRLEGRHFPTFIPKKRDAKSERTNAARMCAVCAELSKATHNPKDRHWSTMWCEVCRKVLCVTGGRNCFTLYHTKGDYLSQIMSDSGFSDIADVTACPDNVQAFLASV